MKPFSPRAMAGDGIEANEGYVYLMSSTVASANGQRAYLDITGGDIGLRVIGAYPNQILLVTAPLATALSSDPSHLREAKWPPFPFWLSHPFREGGQDASPPPRLAHY
ncbi:hypothetical protein ACTG15_19910 [Aeromonas sp. 164P]